METKEGLETDTKVAETTQPPQTEVKPPTAEELQRQLDEIKQKYEQTDKGLRSAQATLTQKDRLLKEKEDVREELDTLKNMVKVLATQKVQEEDADSLESVAKENRPDINKAFAELEQKQRAKEYQRKVQEQVDTIKSRVEASGLTEDDERYWEIYKLATSATPADFKLADIRLKKIEKEKETAPVDNKKPTDEKDKVIVELQARLKKLEMKESGQLDSETGLPSGSAANEAEIKKAFREHSDNPKARNDYLELIRNKRGY